MSDNKAAKSLSAIKQYISKNEQNAYRHKANILINDSKKDFSPATRWVCAFIEGDFGQVVIEDLHTLYASCSNTFTTKDSQFFFVAGTLCIDVDDPLFGKIIINIT